MKDRDASLVAQIEDDVLSGKPLADALRKCILLGGRAGSVGLREWATKELKGYAPTDDVPDFRTVGAPILVDAVTGSAVVTGQQISPRQLPDFVHDGIDESVTFRNGVGEIEAMVGQAAAEKGGLKLSLPMAADLGRLIDSESGNPWQHINAIYWSVSVVALQGILDHVRTTLTELIGEIRAGMPPDQLLPTASVADQAVNIAVHGEKARITVTSAQATGGSATASGGEPEQPFWTKPRKIGAFVAGLASVIGLVLAIAQWQGWM